MKKILLLLITILLVTGLTPYALATTTRQSDVNVALLSYNPEPAQPGQVVDLFISVDPGNGESPNNMSLHIVEEYPFVVEKTQDYEYAKSLGELIYTQKLHFRVKIDEHAKDGIIPLRVKYSVNNEDAEREKVFDINVETFDAQLHVTQMKQLPKEVIPGQEFNIELNIFNADDKPVSNVDVTFDLTNTFDATSILNNMVSMQSLINSRLEDINRRVASGLSPLTGITPMMQSSAPKKTNINYVSFATVQSTNKKNLGVIGAKTSEVVKTSLQALPEIKPGIYAIPVYISYNDENNNPFYTRIDVPVKVNMEPELYVELRKTNLRSKDFAGDVVLAVANRGLSDLQYVTVEIEENDDLELLTAPQSVFVGNVKAGEIKNATFTILAKKDKITIPLKIEYRDAFNVEHEEQKEIQHTIINRYFYRDPPYEIWLTWIILGVVVFLLTLYFASQMSKKKK